jgi:hypothetical protein
LLGQHAAPPPVGPERWAGRPEATKGVTKRARWISWFDVYPADPIIARKFGLP